MSELTLINTKQLAEFLGCREQTIHNKVSTAPGTLPPIIKLPGFKGPRWILSDVEAWLREHVTA